MPERAKRQRLIDDIQAECDRRYPQATGTMDIMMRANQYRRLYAVTAGFSKLKGMKVLDVGCGAKGEWGDEYHRRSLYSEPWFARFAALAGADVIGIDKRKSEDEVYKHDASEITIEQTLQKYPSDTFDIVNTSAFLVPVHKQKEHSMNIEVTPLEMLNKYSDADLAQLDDNLCNEALRVLKEGGYFLYNETIFQKHQGQFRNIPRETLFLELGIDLITPHRSDRDAASFEI